MPPSYHHPDADFFRKLEVPIPSTSSHGTEDDIRDKLKPVKTSNWRLEGNKLRCDTDQGPLTQFIPTSHILVGTDSKGMPILRKIIT